MADYDSSIPIRSEADGTDERVHVKIVDGTVPSQRATVDTDGNVHIEVHGNDPAGVDRVLRLSEIGALTPDGIYDVASNTKPANSGLVASERNAAPSDTTQTQRLTSVTNGNKRLLDISFHDEDGDAYSNSNPMPVAIVPVEGTTPVCVFNTNAVVAANASVTHEYIVAGTPFNLQKIYASGSGKIRVEVKTGDSTTPDTVFVGFNSTANTQVEFKLDTFIIIAVGDVVHITITNADKQPQAVYSTLNGYLSA